MAELARKVHAMTGRSDTDYTTWQAAYDLRKLRGKQLVDQTLRTHMHALFHDLGIIITAAAAA